MSTGGREAKTAEDERSAGSSERPSEMLQKRIAVLAGQGKLDEACALLQNALTTAPQDATLQHSLGFVKAKQGKRIEAEWHFRRALEREPERIETLRNLALCLSEQGKHREVLPISRRLVELQPETATNWLELGRVHRRLKELDAAARAFERVVELQPDLADAQHDLGLTLADLGRPRDAEAAYRKSLEIKPDFVEALNNLGVLLEGQGQIEEAIQLLRRAVGLKRAPDLLNNLGVALASNREFAEAIRFYRASLQMDPNYAAALNNLGNAQRSIGEVDEAIVSLRQALRLRPDYAEAYNNLAIALVQGGRHLEAMRYYNQAIHFRPDYPEAHMNRSLDRLAVSDFEAGWIEYEWRWRGKQLRPRYADALRWDGSSPAGKRILIHFEQGLGDTFQFIRYARLLKKLGATVVAEVQKPLVKLLQMCPEIDQVVATGTPIPEFDLHAPLLSLPGLLGTTLATIPADVPYLQPDPQLVEHWRERLADIAGFKIGIAWQGNPEYRGDRHRSVPLRHFATLARIPGVTLISLQKGPGTEQIAEAAGVFSPVVFDDVDTEAGPFMDTAAIIKNLDLIVTSDTALPHLAGALGVAVWMALPVACDWRWMHGREDSPWYPTMRLFRQRERDDWDEVFARIAAALPQRLLEVRTTTPQPGDADQAEAERIWQDAVALIHAGQLQQAEQRLLEALRRDPYSAKVHHDLGVVRGKQRRPELAVASFRRALELNPNSAGTWGNLGLAFLEQDKIDESISHLQRALTLGPNAPETFNNLGVAYMRNSDPRSAAENYQRALRLRPDYAEAHLNFSRALLIQGDFEQGWLEYEWRWKCPGYQPRDDDRPRWAGEPVAGRTILLHAEQGLGDTMQFVRFAAPVKRSGGTVLLECQPPLAAILQGCAGVDQIMPRGAPLPAYDVHAPLMSLPSLLGISLQNVPAEVPYLFAAPELVRTWRERLGRIPGFKVGIAWQGNPSYDGDRNRSLALKRFAPLAGLKDVQLVNLQKGPGGEHLADLADRFPVLDFGITLDGQAGPFMDTAAIMMNLDLVVTADTAIAHLAGALGVPVWLMLSKSPDFRWLLNRDDSPWYPTMRIFRQRIRRQWEEVIQRVTGDLRDRLGTGRFAGSARRGCSENGTGSDQDDRRLSHHRSLRPTLAAEIETTGMHAEAQQLIREGHFQDAADLLRTVLRADPKFTAAHVDLGVALARLREFDEAILHLRQAVELAPDQAIGYGNLGLALLESGAPEEAARVLTAGIKVAPESASLHKHLGTVLLQMDRPEDAISAYQNWVRSSPKSAEAYYQLGRAQQRAGRFADAAQSYRHAQDIRPDFLDAQNQLRDVNTLLEGRTDIELRDRLLTDLFIESDADCS